MLPKFSLQQLQLHAAWSAGHVKQGTSSAAQTEMRTDTANQTCCQHRAMVFERGVSLQAAEHTAAGKAGGARRLLERVLELRPREPSACFALGQVPSSLFRQLLRSPILGRRAHEDQYLEGMSGLEPSKPK
jgi:hypothetical protein